MNTNRKDYQRRGPKKVCFRPGDDVYDHSPHDLAWNDEEFIRIGEIVLKRMRVLRKQRHDNLPGIGSQHFSKIHFAAILLKE